MKTCYKCGEGKPREAFNKNKRRKDGLQSECKECVHEYQQQNRERIRESNREWWQNNPEKDRTYRATRRVRKRGNLTKVDLQQSAEHRKAISNDPCYYCGATEGTFHDDHFFPVGKGGTDVWHNLVRACENCNLRKNNHCGTWFLLRNPQS